MHRTSFLTELIAGLLCLALSSLFAGCGGSAKQTVVNPRDCSVYPQQSSSPYVLPYPVATTYTIGSTTEHGGNRSYAVDFLMPIGSTITAARAGTVFAVQQDYFDSDHLLEQANYVFILQDDTRLALYGHLTHKGALVSVGDQVEIGQTIALSGHSGQSMVPHLHFEVVRCTVPFSSNGPACPDANTVGVPVLFRNTEATPCGLRSQNAYTAEPY